MNADPACMISRHPAPHQIAAHTSTYGPVIWSAQSAKHALAKQLDQYVTVTTPRCTPTAQTLASQFLK